ncbi:MAG TPA: glycosyltransferase family 39 protein, partial [Chloroflexia bacterium]|nr:glycosyltransferase family 39 protein [Chloroflexia bacterium]
LVILMLGHLVIVAARYQAGWIEGLALSWVLGAGITSVLMLWLSGVGIGLNGQVVILSVFAAFTTIAALWGRRKVVTQPTSEGKQHKSTGRPPSTPERLLQWSLCALLILEISVVAVMAVGRPLQVWDSWVNWGVKARIIFLEGGISPAVYSDPSRAVTQLDYPLLVPLNEAWLYRWVGTPDDRLAGVVSLLFYLSLIGIFYSTLRRTGIRHTGALAATVAIATVANIAGLAGIVFSELPLVVLALIASLYLLAWLKHGEPRTLAIAAICAGLMPWTKREGLVLLGALCLALVLTNARSRRAWRAIGAFAISAGLLSAPWYLFMAQQGIVNAAFLPVTPGVFAANIDRWGTILQLVWNSLTSYTSGYIWPLTTIGMLVLYLVMRRVPGGARRTVTSFLPVAAVLYVLMTGFMYFFSAFVPYEQHILASVDRLIMQVTPYLLVWAVVRAHETGLAGLTMRTASELDANASL